MFFRILEVVKNISVVRRHHRDIDRGNILTKPNSPISVLNFETLCLIAIFVKFKEYN